LHIRLNFEVNQIIHAKLTLTIVLLYLILHLLLRTQHELLQHDSEILTLAKPFYQVWNRTFIQVINAKMSRGMAIKIPQTVNTPRLSGTLY
jgi:hypothetical protein